MVTFDSGVTAMSPEDLETINFIKNRMQVNGAGKPSPEVKG